jgi:hypothetical protein
MRRPSRGAAVLAIVALATIAFAPTAGATFPGRNGLIAFQAETEQGLPRSGLFERVHWINEWSQ